MRIVSVNASFAPLTVLSDSGADGPRFSPVFVSKQSASVSPGNSTTQKPFTSFSAAAAASFARETEAHQTAPVSACSSSVCRSSARRFSRSGRSTSSAMSPPEVSPSIKKAVSLLPHAPTVCSSKSAAF